MKERIYRYDNIRLLLIYLVVLGHSMELFLYGKTKICYQIIYTFHMPAFVYLNGKFAKYDRRKIIRFLILPYLVFQTLYLCFDAIVLHNGASVNLQYTTPYWILWYLLSLTFYYLIIPVLPDKNSSKGCAVVIMSFLLALLAGYDKTLGYYLSLSRTIVFAPFFLYGYYDSVIKQQFGRVLNNRISNFSVLLLCLLMICLGELFIVETDVPVQLLYGSYSYESIKATVIDRCVVLITAGSWIAFLNIIVPDRNVPGFTTVGQNTMAVFLFHAFILRLALKYKWFHYSQAKNFLIACTGAVIILIIFGNKYFNKAFHKLVKP